MHAAHPEFIPAVVVLDPPLPGMAAMMCNEADRASTAPYKCMPTWRRRLDGEGGGGGTERAVVVGQRGRWWQDGEGSGPAAGAWRGWLQGHGEGGQTA